MGGDPRTAGRSMEVLSFSMRGHPEIIAPAGWPQKAVVFRGKRPRNERSAADLALSPAARFGIFVDGAQFRSTTKRSCFSENRGVQDTSKDSLEIVRAEN